MRVAAELASMEETTANMAASAEEFAGVAAKLAAKNR